MMSLRNTQNGLQWLSLLLCDCETHRLTCLLASSCMLATFSAAACNSMKAVAAEPCSYLLMLCAWAPNVESASPYACCLATKSADRLHVSLRWCSRWVLYSLNCTPCYPCQRWPRANCTLSATNAWLPWHPGQLATWRKDSRRYRCSPGGTQGLQIGRLTALWQGSLYSGKCRWRLG